MFQFYESEQADLLPLDLDTVRYLCDTASLGHVHFVFGLSSHVFGPFTAVRFLSPFYHTPPRTTLLFGLCSTRPGHAATRGGEGVTWQFLGHPAPHSTTAFKKQSPMSSE